MPKNYPLEKAANEFKGKLEDLLNRTVTTGCTLKSIVLQTVG